MTKNAQDQRQTRPWGVEEDDCRAELQALGEVTGDFYGTLKECQNLLEDNAKFRRNPAGFVDNVRWHSSTESDISKLSERIKLHTTKLFFVIKPFEIQLLLGIRSELRKLRQDVQDLKGLVVTLHRTDTLGKACPIPTGVLMTQTPANIVSRFVAALDNNKPANFHDLAAFPLKEGFDALVYHFAKSTVRFNPGMGQSQRVPEETQYLNLLKSKWILERLKTSSQLAAAEIGSLWVNYSREVEAEIMEEYKRFEVRLVAPPLDFITRLPDDCFSIWIVEAPSVQPPDLAEQRTLEDKILQLTLPSHASNSEMALTLFRTSDVEFRMVTATTITHGTNKVVERESCPINIESTQFVPAYTIPKTAPAGSRSVNNVWLYRAQDQSYQWQYLKDSMDVALFQQALTGYRIFFDVSDVRWSLNGSSKPGKSGKGRVQTWQVKRLPKLVQDEDYDRFGTSPSTSPQSSSDKKFPRRQSSGLSSGATCFSSSSITSRVVGNCGNATVIHPPEPPVLIIYTLCEEKYTFLHLELDTNIFVDEQACDCKKSPQNCLRIVLDSKAKKISLRKDSAKEKHERGLNSWDLARFRIPRHPKYKETEVLHKVKYVCLDFPTVAAKTEFREELTLLLTMVRDWELNQYNQELNRHRNMSLAPGRR